MVVNANLVDGVAQYGIGLAYPNMIGQLPAVTNVVSNNIILTSFYGSAIAYGINMNAAYYTSVYHNTVYFTAPNGYAIMYTGGGAGNDCRDNIFYKTSSNSYCFYNSAAAQVAKNDYNDYFSAGGNYCYNA